MKIVEGDRLIEASRTAQSYTNRLYREVSKFRDACAVVGITLAPTAVFHASSVFFNTAVIINHEISLRDS